MFGWLMLSIVSNGVQAGVAGVAGEASAGVAGPRLPGRFAGCWSSSPLDVAECCRLVDGPQAYTTVKTVMERLVAKGHLRRRKESRAYVYWPAATREEVADSLAAASSQRLVEDFISRVGASA